MLNFTPHRNKKNNRGFTILVAVVTAGMLLIIAVSIADIALKEKILSSSGKDSQIAFYAADTGLECAMYWDVKKGVFSPDAADNAPDASSVSGVIGCNSNNLTNFSLISDNKATSDNSGNNPHVYSYGFTEQNIPVVGGGKTCAQIFVSKTTNDAGVDPVFHVNRDVTRVYTRIDVYGYNTCDPALSRMERGIAANY